MAEGQVRVVREKQNPAGEKIRMRGRSGKSVSVFQVSAFQIFE
jgi:hypothetical protein